MIGHGGWVAGYKSHITFCVKEKVGVVVLMNCADAEPAAFAYRVYDELAPILIKIKQPPAPSLPADVEWLKFVGNYTDLNGYEMKVMMQQNKLVLYEFNYPANETPREGLIELVPEGAHLFRMSAAGGNGETVRFEMDQAGKVSKLWKGENYYLPVMAQK